MIGIYKITSLHNNKVYIGSSDNIDKRIICHKSRLKRNVHHSDYLQNVYNKYGKENLQYSVIDILDNSLNKIEREQFWMDNYKSYDKNFGYNMSKIASSNTTGEVEIYQYDLSGNYIKSWKSITIAAQYYKVSSTSIYKSLTNENRHSANFQWSYIKEDKVKNLVRIYACYTLNGDLVSTFNNAKEASRYVGTERNANIIRACNTNGKYMNYYWVKYDTYEIPKNLRPTV